MGVVNVCKDFKTQTISIKLAGCIYYNGKQLYIIISMIYSVFA